MPVFADRREFIQLVDQILKDYGVVTALGRTLVESLAMDMLRLRHIRAMEIAVLDPGIGGDREMENAIRDRDRAGSYRSDEENDLLLQAYALAEAQLADGGQLDVPEAALPVMAGDLWKVMNEARSNLERERRDLSDLDLEIASASPEDAAHMQGTRAVLLESVAAYENDMKVTDREVFLVGREPDIAAFLTGRKRIAPAQRAVWAGLMSMRLKALEYSAQEVRNADARIHVYRRRHLLTAVEKLDSLNRLGEYEERVRRSVSKTVALIKEVEGLAVIDITE